MEFFSWDMYGVKILVMGTGAILQKFAEWKKSPEEQKAYIKELWQEDPEKYFEWKQYCIDIGALPNLFGHANNPIPIDESKL